MSFCVNDVYAYSVQVGILKDIGVAVGRRRRKNRKAGRMELERVGICRKKQKGRLHVVIEKGLT